MSEVDLKKELDIALKKLRDVRILFYVTAFVFSFYVIVTMFALRMINTSFMSVLATANSGAV